MKWWTKIVEDEKLDNIQKALRCRNRCIVEMAQDGHSNSAIALYFEIRPKMVKKVIAESKSDKISDGRVTSAEEIDNLLRQRDELLQDAKIKVLLRYGFVSAPTYYATLEVLWQMVACNWKVNEIMTYYAETGKRVREYFIREKIAKGREDCPKNADKVIPMLKLTYKLCDISEYLSISENTITDIHQDEMSKDEFNRLKKRERRKLVYECRIRQKMTEVQTAERLGLSRTTVNTDLKKYFMDHPEMLDDVCTPKTNRLNVRYKSDRFDKDYSVEIGDNESELIRLRKMGLSTPTISKKLQIKESAIIYYIRKNENEEGSLHEWKKDIVKKIKQLKDEEVPLDKMAEDLNLNKRFIVSVLSNR